jgi:hypothetical protein
MSGRSRAAVIAAGAGVVAVVLAGALTARSVFNDDPAGRQGADPSTNGSQNAQAGQGAEGGTATPPEGAQAGRTPGPGGRPPDVILVKQPTSDFRAVAYSEKDGNCLPAIRSEPEDRALAGQLQVSAPRQPYTGTSIKFGMRFKYASPSGYYVAAQLRPPGPHGSAGPGWMASRPRPIPPDAGWLDLHFPADFTWDGSGAGTSPELRPGVWTIVWLHVRANGDAFYLGCDGFTAA